MKVRKILVFSLVLLSALALIAPQLNIEIGVVRAPPSDPVFGKTSVGGTLADVPYGYAFASRFQAPEDGVATMISSYIKGRYTSGLVKAMIFADVSGEVGSLLAESETALSVNFTWHDFTVNYALEGGEYYWFGIFASVELETMIDPGLPNHHAFAWGWTYPTVPSEFGGIYGPVYVAEVDSIYVTYTPLPQMILAVTRENQRIYYRPYYDGDWGKWVRLPGKSSDRPASAAIENTYHFVVRGETNVSVLYHGYVDITDGSFSGWTQIPGATSSAPTLASDGVNLYLVVRGLDDSISYNVWNGSWSGFTTIPGSTSDSAGAAVADGNLHLIIRGATSVNTLWHGYVDITDGSFSGWTQIPGATSSAPTLASDGVNLYLVVRGLDDSISYNVWNGSWSGFTTIPGSTSDSPGATVVDGILHLVIVEAQKRKIRLMYSQLDLSTLTLSRAPPSRWTIVGGTTATAPTLAS